MHPIIRETMGRVAVPVLAAAASFAATWLTWPLLQPMPWSVPYVGLVVGAWSGGVPGGLIVLALTGILGHIAFLPPLGAFGTDPAEMTPLIAYLALGACLVLLTASKRKAARREHRDRLWLQAVLSSIGDAVIVTDTGGRVTFLNTVAERLTGWNATEAGGRPLDEVFVALDEQTRARLENPIRPVLRTGEVVRVAGPTLLVSRDGTETLIGDSGAAIRDRRGDVLGTILVFRDMTLERQGERALAKSEEEFRAVFEQSAVGKAVLELATRRYVRVNQTFARMTGYSTGELLGMAFTEIVHPDDREACIASLERLVRGEVPEYTVEERFVRKDGTAFWVAVTVTLIRDLQGRPLRTAAVVQDISDRRRAEDEIRRSEEVLRQILESAPLPMGLVELAEDDRDILHIYANPATCCYLGIEIGTSAGRWLRADIGMRPEVIRSWVARYRECQRQGRPVYFEEQRIDETGLHHYEGVVSCLGPGPSRRDRFCYILEDVTERRVSEQRLREQSDALRQNDRRKDEFLAMLAHELRNPLAAMGHAVEISTRSGSQDHQDWSLAVVGRQIRHLSRLIDDLLDVSRITRGKIQLRREVIELTPALESALETVRPLIEERHHTLHVTLDRDHLWTRGDPTRLEQVVVNLLTNAAKYTDDGGSIWLTAARDDDCLEIRVKDTGVGIAPERIPEMFELFAQGDRSLARSEGGLGLGLTLVKKLVEMHGGYVTARSEGPGRGSEFLVRLQAAAPPAQPHRPAPAQPAREPHQPQHILVVDDNLDTARGMARLLKLLGHEVRLAYSGEEAIEVARKFTPDFVLLDIGLPGMDGYEVARRLRDVSCCPHAVIIAISGYGQEEDRRRSREAGFDHHLVKPLDYDALLDILHDGAARAAT